MVEINCETDFVARTDKFKAFCRDIAMHIAASKPEVVSPEDLPETFDMDCPETKHFKFERWFSKVFKHYIIK